MVRENTSGMVCVDNQRGGDRNPYYTPTKMGMVTRDTGNIEMAAVRSLQ